MKQNPAYLQKDAVFIQRQKEIQSLHHQLHSVIQEMNEISPVFDKTLGIEEDSFDEEEEIYDSRILNKPEISAEQEVRLLVREIRQLQNDVLTVQHLLYERCRSSQNRNTRVALLSQQLLELSHILEGQLFRAKRLLEQ
ncbi:hypothetical protein TRFO_33187 [Tritrichomonas foetus]|uniref:Uncharacterized protein n=1 Tax=Tritrichomonas foetus TaxID=1144522 RepID=A0A1J4JSH3_9EUKA|nr:hypothetical protein TRFO_33187 [Tritrichomonas foetus]|eukprot:OHT00197.1 hypothetical protein TRFO_33187 [Tritrichomonas foetus]